MKLGFANPGIFGISTLALFTLAIVKLGETSPRHIRDVSVNDKNSVESGGPKGRLRRQDNNQTGNDEEVAGEEGSDVRVKIPITSKIKYEPFIVPKGYNKLQVPSFGYAVLQSQGPLAQIDDFELFDGLSSVDVTLRIRNVNDMDEMEEEIVFAADLILKWTDHMILQEAESKYISNSTESGELFSDRKMLEHLFKTLDPAFLTEIWKPDIYIENLVKAQHPEVMSQPITVRVNEVTGQVIYISKLRIRLECDMDFHYYPADTQTCKVVLRSNSYSEDELSLNWGRDYGVLLEDCGGTNFDFQVSDESEATDEEGYIMTKSRKFSILKFNVLARRKLSYHITQTYLPSTFFLIITWLCFLVPPSMVEAKIGISMTTLLTLTAMFASVRENSPIVSYVRAIDIWMLACIIFVFLTLLQISVALWLKRAKYEEEKSEENATEIVKTNAGGPDKSGNGAEVDDLELGFKPSSRVFGMKSKGKAQLVSEFVEKFAFIIFATMFIIFSVIYWSWVLIASGHFEWVVDKDFNCAPPDE